MMVKANAILAAFSLIFLILLASIVHAGDGETPDAAPRATVGLSQLGFSAADAASTQAAETRTEANAAGDADATTTNAETGADRDAGDRPQTTARGNNDAAAGAAPVLLGSADDTCMGSSAGGGQGTGFGFSLGSTWTDENCKMLKNARELKSHGHHAAAKARLCMDTDNALAFELAGEPCPRALPSARAAIETIQAQNPGYRAATAPGFQTATLTDTASRGNRPSAESRNTNNFSGLDSPSGEGGQASKVGTLLAMVISAVTQVASTVSAGFDIDWDAASAMDGIE